MRPPISKRTWTLVILIGLVAIVYSVFELGIQIGEDDKAEREELARNALLKSTEAFQYLENNFTSDSRELSGYLKSMIESGAPKSAIIDQLNRSGFWGVSIFAEERLWLWSSFGIESYPDDAEDIEERQHVSIKRDNNVIYLSSQVPFFIEEDGKLVRYDIFTRKKIQQETTLEIGESFETQLTDLLIYDHSYPVHYAFFRTLPDDVQFQIPVTTHSLDSAGVFYTLEEDYPTYASNKERQYFLYRAVFYLMLIIFTTLFLLSLSRELNTWSSLILKLIAILSAWAFFSNIEYGLSWIELFPNLEQGDIPLIKDLMYYCVNSVFMLLVTLALFSSVSYGVLKSSSKISDYSSFSNFLFGFGSTFLITFYFFKTFLLFRTSGITALNLDILPQVSVFVFYLASGVFSISMISILCLLGWFILRSGGKNTRMQLSLMTSGFLLGLAALYIFDVFGSNFSWISLISLLTFVIIQGLFFLVYKKPFIIKYSSRLRLLILFGAMSATITYTAVFQGTLKRIDNQMLDAAEAFIQESEPLELNITRDILMELEKSLSVLTSGDLEERQDFVESFFIQRTRSLIKDEWNNFSFSAQFIDTTGNVIAEYNSDLDSPSWSSGFLIQSLRLQFEQERIRLDNMRPVITDRPVNENTSSYSAFRRGWIPLHEKSGDRERIGWILCSVYKERPQYDKPLRAVMAAESYENWQYPINLTEFIDGTPARSSLLGIPLELPGLFMLPEPFQQQIKEQNYVIRNKDFEGQGVRELYLSFTEDRIIRVATNEIEPGNHFFSILRFFFCILVAGLILLGSLFWKKDLNILGHNRRFRDRLIDRFTLASLFCLMALSVTTYYAINDQNKENVQSQLLNKVKNMAEALTEEDVRSEGDSIQNLDALSSALDADATLYKNQKVQISTATQIYGQHILPVLLPWDVYESLYQERNKQDVRNIKIGNNDLLVGYRPWFNDQGEIGGIVSIPTFLKAPKFNQQLLATTSYLLGIYVLIFGLFIIGAAIISTQLTEPLMNLRQGLKTISKGDLETHLPVNTKDEIGSLSNAYNVMVDRLKGLQKELASAEREEAWKEMAQQVAHEIKNPLTPMKLNLQHLERQLQSPNGDIEQIKPKIRKITRSMIEQIDSLNHIASDFSKFAKPIDEEFKAVEINDLLVSVGDLYRPEENLEIKTNLHETQLFVKGVKEELRRVLVNIMKNAYEAMPGGGSIKLCSLSDHDKDHVLIEIIDSGSGIPDDIAENIFVPNFSTKSSGTGLGLAISKKIIEEHNGKISFESNEGKGTIFRISLPLADIENS